MIEQDTPYTETEWRERMKTISGNYDAPRIIPKPDEQITCITPHAQLCPVCEGTGAFPPRSELQRPCHGCDGKGWVVVR